jgi:hypothetical protein
MIIRVLISMLLAVSILPAFLLGCDSTRNTDTESDMIPKAAIPPIDVSTPINTETATFALG